MAFNFDYNYNNPRRAFGFGSPFDVNMFDLESQSTKKDSPSWPNNYQMNTDNLFGYINSISQTETPMQALGSMLGATFEILKGIF